MSSRCMTSLIILSGRRTSIRSRVRRETLDCGIIASITGAATSLRRSTSRSTWIGNKHKRKENLSDQAWNRAATRVMATCLSCIVTLVSCWTRSLTTCCYCCCCFFLLWREKSSLSKLSMPERIMSHTRNRLFPLFRTLSKKGNKSLPEIKSFYSFKFT